MLDLILGSMVRWRWQWLGATALGVVATLDGCVLHEGVGPTSTELYAMIDAHCQSATTCGCGWAGSEPEACTPELEARWKARQTTAQRLALTYDAQCMATLTAQVEEYECFWAGGQVPLCTDFCAVFHGDREQGQACEGDVHASTCAQGLVCHEGTCASPCSVMGGRAQGEPCASEQFGEYDDCAAGLWCSWSTGTCEVTGGVGASCVEGGCNEGLSCGWYDGRCAVAPTEGQSCDDLQCAPGLDCRYELEGDYGEGSQVCRAYATEGESCNGRRCLEGLWCGPNEVCVEPPGEGAPCLYESICDESTVCDFARNLCVAPPDVGQDCVQGTCAPGAQCQPSPSGLPSVCAATVANGEMCSGHRQCSSGYCPNGFCWARPLEGESCEGAGVCAPGLVCNGTTCEPTLTRGPAACGYLGW